MKSVERQELINETVENIVNATRVESPNAFVNTDYIRSQLEGLVTKIFVLSELGKGPSENID